MLAPPNQNILDGCDGSGCFRNCSGVCTASRSDIGEVVACPESKGLLVQLLTETLQVAISNGVGLPHEEVDGIVKEYE